MESADTVQPQGLTSEKMKADSEKPEFQNIVYSKQLDLKLQLFRKLLTMFIK